jgi:hypothetical protein
MLAVASSPRGSKAALTGVATLSQAHLIQPSRALGGRTPGKILLSRVLTATSMTSCRTPVIQTNDVWLWWGRRLRLAKQAQDRIATPADAQFASKVCPWMTPCGESKLAERFLQPLGTAERAGGRDREAVQQKSFEHRCSFYRRNDAHA